MSVYLIYDDGRQGLKFFPEEHIIGIFATKEEAEKNLKIVCEDFNYENLYVFEIQMGRLQGNVKNLPINFRSERAPCVRDDEDSE